MGAIKNTWSQPTKKSVGPKGTAEKGGHPAVTSLQKWLSRMGVLGLESVTGTYDEITHAAVDQAWNSLVGKTDEASKNAYKAVDYLLSHKWDWIRANPSIVSQALVSLQQAAPAPSAKAKSIEDTPYYEIMYDGRKLMLPLALIYNRGFPMYRVILEQNGLLDITKPLDERTAQLNKAFQAIQSSIPASDPNNANILYIITEADKDLRESWARGQAQGTTESISKALERLVPEFSKASDTQKDQIIGMIYYRFASADKFIEPPPNINSRITDLAEFRRNQHSLTEVVAQRLREMGLRR